MQALQDIRLDSDLTRAYTFGPGARDGSATVKPRALFLVTAVICLVAAAVTYLKDSDRAGLTLMWIGIAMVFATIGIARRADGR